VPAYLLNATVIGVLAQRLVRQLCAACSQPDLAITPALLQATLPGLPVMEEGAPFRPHKPVGCDACRQTGFRGRRGLFELLLLSPDVRRAIDDKPDLPAVRARGRREGLTPLRLAGLRHVAAGHTTVDEVLRSTPAWEG
jgi:general secretion pathway protein E